MEEIQTKWMSINTLAKYLDTTPMAIMKRRERGTFPTPKKMGGLNRWSRDAIDEWLEGGDGP